MKNISKGWKIAAIAVGSVAVVATGVIVAVKYLRRSCDCLDCAHEDEYIPAPHVKAPINPECNHFNNCDEDCAKCEA